MKEKYERRYGMRTKRISSSEENHPGYGAGSGDTERYKYLCPCGKGIIVEEHDNIPGFRDHDIWIECEECKSNYRIDTTKGVRSWDLVKL